MQDLTLSILGFPAVNKDLKVELLDPVTRNVVREVRPFLDGTVRVPKIDAGAYELAVRHPNLTLPVLRRPIRVLPTGSTKISVLLDPSKFRDTPIEDIPEANLAPVLDVVTSVAETMTPLAGKVPGEAILAKDWNAMAGAVRDLAHAVGELSRLVSPTGHDHPELVAKLEETQSNFETLLNSVTAALTEIQRQIQTRRFREQVQAVLDRATVDPTSAKGRGFMDLVTNLEKKTTETPTIFGREVRNAAVQLSTRLEALMDEKSDDPDFATSVPVRQLGAALDLHKQQRTTTWDSELTHLRKIDRTIGPGSLGRG